MNYLIMLAGGTGTRMNGAAIPKQYMEVGGKPIIMYALETFQKHEDVEGIVIVAHEQWSKAIENWMDAYGIGKFLGFADPGATRQGSIYNGLKFLKSYASPEDLVIIHDAARPLVSRALIDASFAAFAGGECDAVMPVLTAKDTYYLSADGKSIDGLISRKQLYAGQAPETFRFGKYLELHEELGMDGINCVTGSTELAYRGGMRTILIPGEDGNFKITTQNDLDMFRTCLEGGRL